MQVHVSRWTVKSIARKPTRPVIKPNQVMVIDPTYVATIRATTGRTSVRRAAPGRPAGTERMKARFFILT